MCLNKFYHKMFINLRSKIQIFWIKLQISLNYNIKLGQKIIKKNKLKKFNQKSRQVKCTNNY